MKSRSLWLKAGDKKSSFFHCQCRARLSRNHISEIIDDEGVTIKGQDLLKQSTSKHFQKLFKDDGCSYDDVSTEFLHNVPSLVSIEDNCELMKLSLSRKLLKLFGLWSQIKLQGQMVFRFIFIKFTGL